MNYDERKYLERQMKRFSGKKAIIVEVGSWKGISSMAISKGINKYCPKSAFYCVDIFSEDYYDKYDTLKIKGKKVIDVFEQNMKHYQHTTMVMTSLEAAERFKNETIDFIFIDADHSYEMVKSDILAWLPKVKTGGIMCGHDYTTKKYGVIKAVNELFSVHSNPARSIWEVVK